MSHQTKRLDGEISEAPKEPLDSNFLGEILMPTRHNLNHRWRGTGGFRDTEV